MTSKNTNNVSIRSLEANYERVKPRADRLMIALCEQFEQLFSANHITLGVPMECRVKTWSSISEKIERRELSLNNITDLDDLVGLRLILLFKRDLDNVDKLIKDTFKVIAYEDTSTRLSETQFGYQSFHYVISLPKKWLAIPSFRDLGKLKTEIQVRTLAQHIWAAASHHLQYKQESSVPSPVMRSIYRVSAILETVDLELERVLTEREDYITYVDTSREEANLNVNLVERILDDLLPVENKGDSEPYSDLIVDLFHFGIDTVGKLRNLIQSNLETILKNDQNMVKEAKQALPKGQYIGTSPERIKRSVYFIHVGLSREAMSIELGEKWLQYNRDKSKPK